MLPISVLVPTLNCAALVPAHLESLRSWLDLAEEVVVVDSDSCDDTVKLLRAGLNHPRVRFLNHPRGLYQSWNFGIRNASAKYIYVSTVGDSITRQGVQSLFDLAEKLHSDVVISKPDFVNGEGEALPDQRWPIDVILRQLQIKSPQLLSTTEQFYFAVTNLWGAILGSSASNLYRADCLKQRPFPTEFGTAGDCGWGVQNIFDVRIAITPERFSTFRFHEKAYAPDEYYVESLFHKFHLLARSVVAIERLRNPVVDQVLEELQWPELEKALELVPIHQAKLEHYREQIIPWYLNPRAWQVRAARKEAEKRIKKITEEVIPNALRTRARLDEVLRPLH